MGLALFMFLIILIAIVAIIILVAGIVFIILGTQDKKNGKKGTIRTVGVVMILMPVLICVCIGIFSFWNNSRIKCVADEWRYSPFFMPSNAVIGSGDMLRELLDAYSNNDKSLFYLEFSKNVTDDRYFGDKVDEFFDDIKMLDADLDPDLFLKNYGKSVLLNSPFDASGYMYSAEIDGKTYYCYLRVCNYSTSGKDNIGLQQFIICTEDKLDELKKIIKDVDSEIYLEVLE